MGYKTKICWWLLHHQPLRDPPHDLTSHLHERRLMELSLRVQELPLVSPDGDGLGRLPWQWISKCFFNFPLKLCRLRVMFLNLMFYNKSALVQMIIWCSLPRLNRFLSDSPTYLESGHFRHFASNRIILYYFSISDITCDRGLHWQCRPLLNWAAGGRGLSLGLDWRAAISSPWSPWGQHRQQSPDDR